MKANDFPAHLANLIINTTGFAPWYMLAAQACIAAGHIHYITQRNSDDLYLVRMWLTPPKPSTEEGGRFESGGAVLLHWFACGDDDQALHDHPWSFITTILAGGYWEHLPEANWAQANITKGAFKLEQLGPPWQARRIWRGKDDEILKASADLHCVIDPLPDTFTLVRTGTRVREWGFHPEGRPWVNRSTYLDRTKPANCSHV